MLGGFRLGIWRMEGLPFAQGLLVAGQQRKLCPNIAQTPDWLLGSV